MYEEYIAAAADCTPDALPHLPRAIAEKWAQAGGFYTADALEKQLRRLLLARAEPWRMFPPGSGGMLAIPDAPEPEDRK